MDDWVGPANEPYFEERARRIAGVKAGSEPGAAEPETKPATTPPSGTSRPPRVRVPGSGIGELAR
jgi:hypothetical protein